MEMILEHAKNPDIDGGGYWQDPVSPKLTRVPVASLKEASEKLRAWVTLNGLGGGNITKRCGLVMAHSTKVARVSYNGRVWDATNETKEIAI